ncbi:glycosyltransferase [Limosilactobacillus mucosae]|uniref:glycosyltransferase n=1 Tax=Limosilactobacillus mucosae TaxID=97478 RepID=UPI00233F3A1B|nr:glycosyltransferase [Limosilactobacillus mucosae]MDC2842573.1 glycosyltransferase [Limosilactobacillus mucosae]
MNSNSDTVCALVVTYNRATTLMHTLNGILNQYKKVNGIFIFNNHGNDDTEIKLKKYGFIDETIKVQTNKIYERTFNGTQIYYYLNDDNLGGAGGFSKGIGMLSKLNYKYAWIMDDDVFPEPDCLSKILEQMDKHSALVGIPNRTDDNYIDKACVDIDFDNYHKFWTELRKTKISGPFKEKGIIVCDMPFEGPTIQMDLLRKVGIPDSGYFIEYDDSDYAQRLQKYSKIVFATEAQLHRQLAKKSDTNEPNPPYNWRNYYKIRNNIVFDQRYGKNWKVRYLSPIILVAHHIVLAIRQHHIRHNLPIILKAYVDGIFKKMGKRVNPNY